MIANSDEDFLKKIIDKPGMIGELGGNSMERFKKLFYKDPPVTVNENINLLRRKVLLAVDAIGLPIDYFEKLGNVKKNTYYDIVLHDTTPTLKTLHQIAFLLQINPQILLITKSDLASYRKKISYIYTDLNIESRQIKNLHYRLNSNGENRIFRGIDLLHKRTNQFIEQIKSYREIWPAKIGIAFGILLSNQPEDVLASANLAIILSRNHYK